MKNNLLAILLLIFIKITFQSILELKQNEIIHFNKSVILEELPQNSIHNY